MLIPVIVEHPIMSHISKFTLAIDNKEFESILSSDHQLTYNVSYRLI